MIVLYNPKATKPRDRRLPLSILAIAAVLEGKEEYAIVISAPGLTREDGDLAFVIREVPRNKSRCRRARLKRGELAEVEW